MGKVFADLAEGDWQRLSAGPGSKGERWYDWQCLVLAEAADADKGYYLLFRRSCAQPEKWQAYLVWGPRPATCPPCRVPHRAPVQMAKQEVGLDEYEVRNARGWDRHMILAPGPVSVVRAASLPPPDPQKKRAGPGSLAAFRRARGLAGG